MTPTHELSLAVVGISHPNPDGSNRRFEIATLRPGDPVELRREPRNRHDPYAVGVWSPRDIRLGYLSAERAPWIGAKLLDGLELQAVFQEVNGAIAVIRARIGGGAPTLPPPKPRPWGRNRTSTPTRTGPNGALRAGCAASTVLLGRTSLRPRRPLPSARRREMRIVFNNTD